jgi:DNA polymerase-3 subunit epsilon
VSARVKFALALAALAVVVVLGVAGLGIGVWSSAAPGDRAVLTRVLTDQTALVLGGGVLLLTGLGLLVAAFFNLYVLPPKRLAAETRLIASANPSYRLDAARPAELGQLAAAVNELADRYQAEQVDIQERIAAARADLEQERNRLAALMSELTLAVLVCNAEGRILLYNAAARRLLDRGPGPTGAPIGLGRSVFGVIDRSLIAHALERIRDGSATSHVATASRGEQLLRVHVAPVAGAEAPGRAHQEPTASGRSAEPPGRAHQEPITGGRSAEPHAGFVLTLEDMTRHAEISERRDALLRALTEGSRASVGNIRAAVESMLDYPEMGPEQQRRFTEIIRDEALGLGARVERTLTESADYLKDRWLLADILGRDLLMALVRTLEREQGLRTSSDEPDGEVWLEVDSYAVVRAVTHLAARLRAECGVAELELRLRAAGRHGELDLRWQGTPLDAETLRTWTEQPLSSEGAGLASTLKEVLERHGGEVWCGADAEGGGAHVRLLLPLAEVAPGRVDGTSAVPAAAAAVESRPAVYDFDLFGRAEERSEWDERRLDELAYTVFDTETTGLFPTEGDEIISVGAVRIVNLRLLRHETFEQLVDPGRPVSAASIRVHGIGPELLDGQPTIQEILPAFASFAEDTVLVGHNVAFDLQFLRLKEASAGVRLSQPVLDTLLLSAVASPEHDHHSLEAMAARLGVSVIGRHTALGDAILTGEIFLRLLRLLASQGVVTLGDARQAALRTQQARVSDALYAPS